MSLLIDHAGNVPARGRLISAAVCLALSFGSRTAAQPAQDADRAADVSAIAKSNNTLDADEPSPLVLERFAPRPLSAADVPPVNPLLGYGFPRASTIFSGNWHADGSEYYAIIKRESLAFGLPAALVDAVMAVESGYNSAAIGSDGEVGLMQVMLPTARLLGFAGTSAELANPEVNIHYGTKYLAGAWRLANGDLCTTAMKYRAGHGETRFSYLSVDYCLRVRKHLAMNGVSATGSVPQPTVGSASRSHQLRSRLSGSGLVNFTALNARLREMTDHVAVYSSR